MKPVKSTVALLTVVAATTASASAYAHHRSWHDRPYAYPYNDSRVVVPRSEVVGVVSGPVYYEPGYYVYERTPRYYYYEPAPAYYYSPPAYYYYYEPSVFPSDESRD